MNKSVAVFNLPLPTDVLHTICGFIYYTHEECINKIKKQRIKLNTLVVLDLIRTEDDYDIFCKKTYSLKRVQLQYIICKICNNYKITGGGIIHKNCVCLCNNDEDIICEELDDNTYQTWYIQ